MFKKPDSGLYHLKKFGAKLSNVSYQIWSKSYPGVLGLHLARDDADRSGRGVELGIEFEELGQHLLEGEGLAVVGVELWLQAVDVTKKCKVEIVVVVTHNRPALGVWKKGK